LNRSVNLVFIVVSMFILLRNINRQGLNAEALTI